MLYRPQKNMLVKIFTYVLKSLEKEDYEYLCNSIEHLHRCQKITDQEYHFTMNYLYSQMPTPYRFRRFYKHKLFFKDNRFQTKRFISEIESKWTTLSWWSCREKSNREESLRQRIKYVKLLIRNLKR